MTQGKLKRKDFVITSNSNETLPNEFSLYASVLGQEIRINFTRIDGLINDPMLNSNIYVGNEKGVVLENTESTVVFIICFN